MENKINKEEINFKIQKPSEEESQKIINQFNEYLINIEKNNNIKEATNFFCLQYDSYQNYFFENFLLLIKENLSKEQKIEYLYLMTEIIKSLNANKSKNNISQSDLSYLLFCVKEICKYYHYSMNYVFIKLVKDTLNDLKEYKIYNESDINNIIMELRITTDPKITGSDTDRFCLRNLFNEQSLKIDKNMVDLFRDIESVDRRNINILRMNLINKENKLIEKQMLLYNKNLEQIKDINEMIDIIDQKFPGIK